MPARAIKLRPQLATLRAMDGNKKVCHNILCERSEICSGFASTVQDLDYSIISSSCCVTANQADFLYIYS